MKRSQVRARLYNTSCLSCGEQPSFRYTYKSGRRKIRSKDEAHICGKCIRYLQFDDPSKPVSLKSVGDSRRRNCVHCQNSKNPKEFKLVIVRCEFPGCGLCNYHRLCFEHLRSVDPSSHPARATIKVSNIEDSPDGRKLFEVFCDSHAKEGALIQAEEAKGSRDSIPDTPKPKGPGKGAKPAATASQSGAASAASTKTDRGGKRSGEGEGQSQFEDSESSEDEKSPGPSGADSEAKHYGTKALKKKEASRASQLLQGTDVSQSKLMLERLGDMLENDDLQHITTCSCLSVAADLERFAEQVDHIISQMSPSSKCAVVGPSGAGKSFLINCLLACSVEPPERYASKVRAVFGKKRKESQIDLEAFHDQNFHGSPPVPKTKADFPEAEQPEDCLNAIRPLYQQGNLAMGTPGWILPSESGGDVTSRANVTILYGETYHLKVQYVDEKEAKEMAFQHFHLVNDDVVDKKEKEFAAQCWKDLVDTKKTPPLDRVAKAEDIVLKQLRFVGTTEIYAGTGQDAEDDRLFICGRLSVLMSSEQQLEQTLIKSVTLYVPAAVLTHSRITDVMGSNDCSPMRTLKTRQAINDSHALLVVLPGNGLNQNMSAADMLANSSFLNQMLEEDSEKKIHFLICMEKVAGGSVSLSAFQTKETSRHLDRVFATAQKTTLAELRNRFKVITDSEGSPNADDLIERTIAKRVSISAVSPALFFSMHINRVDEEEAIRRTGMLQTFGLFRYLDTTAVLDAFKQCTFDSKVSQSDTVVPSVLESLKAHMTEFEDDSKGVEAIRATAFKWTSSSAKTLWNRLQGDLAHQFEEIFTIWFKDVATEVKKFRDRIQSHVFVWDPKVERKVIDALAQLRDSNRKSSLESRRLNSKPLELGKVLFRGLPRIPFDALQQQLDSLFEGFLDNDFQEQFQILLTLIFPDKAKTGIKAFKSIQTRMWKVARIQASSLYKLLLKQQFQIDRLISKMEKHQLAALKSIYDSKVEKWSSIRDISALRAEVASDLKPVYEQVCLNAEEDWLSHAKAAVRLFHKLLFKRIDKRSRLPDGLDSLANSECLLHSTLLTFVKDARTVGAANVEAATLPKDQVIQLQKKLTEWNEKAKQLQQKIEKELSTPLAFMEKIGKSLVENAGASKPKRPSKGSDIAAQDSKTATFAASPPRAPSGLSSSAKSRGPKAKGAGEAATSASPAAGETLRGDDASSRKRRLGQDLDTESAKATSKPESKKPEKKQKSQASPLAAASPAVGKGPTLKRKAPVVVVSDSDEEAEPADSDTLGEEEEEEPVEKYKKPKKKTAATTKVAATSSRDSAQTQRSTDSQQTRGSHSASQKPSNRGSPQPEPTHPHATPAPKPRGSGTNGSSSSQGGKGGKRSDK